MGILHLSITLAGGSMKLAFLAILFVVPACIAQGKGKGNANDLVISFEDLFAKYLNDTALLNNLEDSQEFYFTNCFGGKGGKGCNRKGKGGKGKKSKKQKKGKTSKKSKNNTGNKGKKGKNKGKQPQACPEVEDITEMSGEALFVMNDLGWANDYAFDAWPLFSSLDNDLGSWSLARYIFGYYGFCLPGTFPQLEDAVGSRCVGSYNATEVEMIENATRLAVQYSCVLEAIYDSQALAYYAKEQELGMNGEGIGMAVYNVYDNYDWP